MKSKTWGSSIFRFFKFIYIKLFRIHDTPQRIALGVGLGTFSGIIPGTGPIFAMLLALLFHANRAAALAMSLLTNTWTSILIFLLSIKMGSAIMKADWQAKYKECLAFLKVFKFNCLLETSTLRILTPLIIGYIVTALATGLITYLVTLVVLKIRRRDEDKSRINLSR